MKPILFLFIAALTTACSTTTTPVTVPPPTGTISYKIDTTTYTWSTGSYGFFGSHDTCETLIYSQQDPATASRGVTFQLVVDTLKERKYSDTTAKMCLGRVLFVMITHQNTTYSSFSFTGNTWVEFTLITDSTVSGTFAFKGETVSGSQSLTVTDGVFTNVRLTRN